MLSHLTCNINNDKCINKYNRIAFFIHLSWFCHSSGFDLHPTMDLFLPLNRTSSSFLMTAEDLWDEAV